MSHLSMQGGSASTRKTKSYDAVKKMVLMAVFAALAYATMFVLRFKVMFLTFDAKDAVITLASMLLGPVAGVAISLVVSLLELISVSDTGVYGFIMNFASSATISFVAGLVYKKKHTLAGAIAGLCAGVVSVVAVMMLLNLLVTPYYMHADTQEVIKLIPTLLFPFNLTKALLNAGLVLTLYRPVSVALRRSRVLPAQEGTASYTLRMDRRSILTLVAGIAIVIICVLCFLFLLEGSFQWHK